MTMRKADKIKTKQSKNNLPTRKRKKKKRSNANKFNPDILVGTIDLEGFVSQFFFNLLISFFF